MEHLEALYLEALGVGQGVGGGGKRRLPARVPEMEHDPGLLTIKQDVDSENSQALRALLITNRFPQMRPKKQLDAKSVQTLTTR